MIEIEFFTKDDASKLIEWSKSVEYLMQWAGTGFTYPLTDEQIMKYIEGANDLVNSECFAFKVILKETGQVIGHISLAKVDRIHSSARISKVVIGEDSAKGKGIGTQMIEKVLGFAFQDLNLHRVSLGVFDFNKSAIACYEKVGFTKEGLLREVVKVNDDFWNLFEMGILAREWKEK